MKDVRKKNEGIRVCMVVPDRMVKGGIASVVNGYRDYDWGGGFDIVFVESYCDGSKWKKLSKAVSGYLKFYRELRRNRPDIVHIHSSFGPSFYRKLPFIHMAVKYSIPVVNHIHGSAFDVFYSGASERKKKLVRAVYLKCTRLIALSEKWKDCLTQIVPAEQITVIGNYANVSDHPDVRTGPGERRRQILYLGMITKEKGCLDIPLILEKVVKHHGPVRLVMAGDGAVEAVKAMFRERGLEDQVSFPGWVRGVEKDRLLEESSIFLFPSYHEAMPMAVIEAMAYGVPVVASHTGGIPVLIRDGISGSLCTPGDIEGFAAETIKLLSDTGRWRSFSEQAGADASERFGIKTHVEKLRQLYETVHTEKNNES